MSGLLWRHNTPVEFCERAYRPDGQFYQVSRQDTEVPSRRWLAHRFDGKPTLLGAGINKYVAKAFCLQDWRRDLAYGVVKPGPGLDPDRPDNYAIPPFEPSGDPEWDGRARGGVDKS